MHFEEEGSFLDLFNQPITIDSKLLVSLHGRIKVCKVVKFNRKTLLVQDVNFKNGFEHRISPEAAVVISTEDLMVLALKGKI